MTFASVRAVSIDTGLSIPDRSYSKLVAVCQDRTESPWRAGVAGLSLTLAVRWPPGPRVAIHLVPRDAPMSLSEPRVSRPPSRVANSRRGRSTARSSRSGAGHSQTDPTGATSLSGRAGGCATATGPFHISPSDCSRVPLPQPDECHQDILPGRDQKNTSPVCLT